MKPKVFISYSRADKKIAESLVNDLSKSGIETWIDSSIKAGESWEELIKEEIKSASYFVVLLSDNLINSPGAMMELGAAIATGIQIIPVLIGDTKIPFDISKYKYLDMRGANMKNALQQLRETVIENDESKS